MMFADLIDPIDFIEHLQGLGFELDPQAALPALIQQVRDQDHDGHAQAYFESLKSGDLNVHPEIRDALGHRGRAEK